MRKILTKTRLSVLSALLTDLSAAWLAIILISPGLGAVISFRDFVSILTGNLPFGILSLLLAMKFAEEAK